MEILAGFEVAQLAWNGHDLAQSTNHIPESHMHLHYELAKDLGIKATRDGLLFNRYHDSRLSIAADLDMQVYWDLWHFNEMSAKEATTWSKLIGTISIPYKEFWVCPCNEPSVTPTMLPLSKEEVIERTIYMSYTLKEQNPNIKLLQLDAICGPEENWHALDILNLNADMIGLNMYPHTLRAQPHELLIEAHRRYHKPIMISETSWHDGFHVWDGIYNKGDWLRFMVNEAKLAQQAGANITGICWYPFVDCPPWDAPQADVRWSHGAYNEAYNVNDSLRRAIHEAINA